MERESNSYRVGIDVGSTTAKLVAVDDRHQIRFSAYQRHLSSIPEAIAALLEQLRQRLGDCRLSVVLTGSVGMGIAERLGLPFLQEVVAASVVIKRLYPEINALIDMGGEDAKLILFQEGKSPIMRMNGSCAGGTGAFLDQMASLLGVSVNELDTLAAQSTQRYSISSRCGVFAKTDIQNLISRNVPAADIAASIFHALATQTVTTLQRGLEIQPKVIFCGGPFAHLAGLRRTFMEVMGLAEHQVTIPDNASLLPAHGCAIDRNTEAVPWQLDELIHRVRQQHRSAEASADSLPPLFDSTEALSDWKAAKRQYNIDRVDMSELEDECCYLGVDSGSTTTKLVLLDARRRLVFDYYAKNRGNPLEALRLGLVECQQRAERAGKSIRIHSACVTGYGEDLLKKAYGFDFGIVETIGHYMGAMLHNPEVSFILDIGGQDMKAIFVDNGVITRLEVNEACSSGCGSFIESFANSMNYGCAEFAELACTATTPADLGTRCTVFMNSRVKQALRSNATAGDIAAGLSYSVIKNMLYKVLKLRSMDELGGHISVQGGTFKNLSVVKAMEQVTGRSVHFTDLPELMGAIGCAVYAMRHCQKQRPPVPLESLTLPRLFSAKQLECNACENHCAVQRYRFDNRENYFSGNKCEKKFSNRGQRSKPGVNGSELKTTLLFDRDGQLAPAAPTIGIPRILNFYENYPFWHKLFTEMGLSVVLSDPSNFDGYQASAHTIMSDNICFPAKLAHSHVVNLVQKGVERIFIPYVIYEAEEQQAGTNSFNCPVVAGYSDVLRSAISCDTPIESPSISFRDTGLLKRACAGYLRDLLQGSYRRLDFERAFDQALAEQADYVQQLQLRATDTVEQALLSKRMVIVLAGRPYHHDPLIQQKVSNMIADQGVDVVTEDIVRDWQSGADWSRGTVAQWKYTNTLLRAAHWVAQRSDNVHLVQISSFGCGPDAAISDEVGRILSRANKTHTLLKVDDVTNLGSLRLRIRSLIDSLQYKQGAQPQSGAAPALPPAAPFTEADRHRKILLPFFSEHYSPMLPAIFRQAGYQVENLPPSDKAAHDLGLTAVNNEICFPAIVVVGSVLQALQSGRYDLEKVAIGITQTGGQCRATNYLSLLKNALAEHGYHQVPVVSLNFDPQLASQQPGFNIDWKRIAKPAFNALLFSDALAKMYNAALPREKHAGQAKALRDAYLARVAPCCNELATGELLRQLRQAALEFEKIVCHQRKVARVGVVGEIFVKFNASANFHSLEWMQQRGIELVIPPLVDFAMQHFVNQRVNVDSFTETPAPWLTRAVKHFGLHYLERHIRRFNEACSGFSYFVPFGNIEQEASNAADIVNLSGQFGEGWLIPAELASFAQQGVHHVVCLQPFGCLANHVVAKGIEKRVMDLYPEMNLLFLDLDNGVSQANLLNRLHFLINNALERIIEVTPVDPAEPEQSTAGEWALAQGCH